jgi:methylenetetrahydrofolate dehydrogenase (NADP+) / methenyltetrahydrofolate cyclohydrolase
VAARLLEGRPVAEAIWRDVDERAAHFAQVSGRPPTLALVSGADEAAAAYGRQIERQFARHGLNTSRASVAGAEFIQHLRGLNADPFVDGILLLTPLPEGVSVEAAALAIDPSKDVDGQHPINLGRLAQRRPAFAPATARGGLELLKHYEIPLKGSRVVVIGRSPVVGMPLALLLIDADATVMVCHSRSTNLANLARGGDVLCVAIGRAGMIGPEYVKPGAVVIDFGTNPTSDGSLVGDVQTDAVMGVAGALTPVPGGTGPTTVSVLAEHTLRAAELRRAG